ncbi:MAG: hypothetical protein U0521_28365 [Anaerolineae bacterium]
MLQRCGFSDVIVATLEAADLGENEAALRIGQAVAAGYGVRVAAQAWGART